MRFEKRPWGWFWVLWETPEMWVKILRVRPGQRTSVQNHEKREEWHYQLSPEGIVSRHVPRQQIHCLYRGLYLEIARGEVDEGDIHRHDDMYGR